MHPVYAIYALLSSVIFIILFPAYRLYARLKGRSAAHFKQRLGLVPRNLLKGWRGSPRIWLHAASLGEVKVAACLIPVLKRRLPDCAVLVSTMTPHGLKMARRDLERDIPVICAPIDFAGAVNKALSLVRPDLVIFLETEIWPNWLFEARRKGISTALVNGRISTASFRNYRRLHLFFRQVLKNLDILSMIIPEDAERVQAMGADPRKITVCGNAKYDALPGSTDSAIETQMRRILDLEPSRPVLVAGSTRGREEAMLLDAYQRIREACPDIFLLIAPRHIVRTESIAALLEKRGIAFQRRSDLGGNGAGRTAPVLILDTFGELFNIYSVATVVFCGGSLVRLGGQNPLEPAVWGKPVLYGPHMDNFLDAKKILEAEGGAIEVSTPQALAGKVIQLLQDPESGNSIGRRARRAALKTRGASDRHAAVIEKLLGR
jgi:3-deoxy-D-manno-octulosonic-acid transferase